jgi:hypothetical protein
MVITTKGNKMYGLPDSAIVGTVRRLSGKLHRVPNRDFYTAPRALDVLGERLVAWIEFNESDKELKEERRKFYEENGYYPPVDKT